MHKIYKNMKEIRHTHTHTLPYCSHCCRYILYSEDSSLLGLFAVTMGQQLLTVQPSNIRNYSDETVSHTRKFVSSAAALCKPQT
jgi:hypothetical protein